MRRVRKPALLGLIALALLALGAASSGIAVGSPPYRLAFSVGPAHYYAGHELSFAAGDAVYGQNPVNWTWDFGDGSSSTDAYGVQHTYASGGTYLAKLTVTTAAGDSATTTRALVIEANTPPVPRLLLEPRLIEVNEQMNLNGIRSTDREDALYETPLTTQIDITGPTSQSLGAGAWSLSLPAAGAYTITLTVTDSQGAARQTTTTLDVLPAGSLPGVAPDARFTHATDFLDVGVADLFDASTSVDPDGTPLSYAWDFGDGTTGTGVTVSHAFSRVGNYTVVLTATDGHGRSATWWEYRAAYGVEASFNVTPLAPTAGSPVVFDGVGSWNSRMGDKSYAWNFGDGTTSTEPYPEHTFAAAGSYVVQLSVSNEFSNVDAVSHVVSVAPGAPPPTTTTTTTATTTPTTTAATTTVSTTTTPTVSTGGTTTAPTTVTTTTGPSTQVATTPAAAPKASVPTSNASPKQVVGTARADRLVGGAGNDVIQGGPGNDVLTGGKGRDTLDGGPGNDQIFAVDGAIDTVRCGRGKDIVTADRIDRVARDCEIVRRPGR